MNDTVLIDGHVHVYPTFDMNFAINSGLKNFAALQRRCRLEKSQKAWLLTERSDCCYFEDFVNIQLDGYYFEKTAEKEALTIRDSATKATQLYVFSGRQIISSENIEICALASSFRAGDKALSAVELVSAVNDAGGLAAVNWAPGKWFGERGNVVQALFDQFTPQQLFISDTTMRPALWPTPRLMKMATRQGFRVISGSDPLPFSGEEKMIAKYAGLVSGQLDGDAPARSLKKLLRATSDISACGRRSGAFSFVRRQTKIMLDKKR